MGDGGAGVDRVFTEQEMAREHFRNLAGGLVAIFSARSPDKQSPNEDAACVLELDAARAVLAVADGVGGQPSGESAAALALRCLKQSLARAARAESSLRDAILDGFEQANRAVMDLGVGAATTLAAVEIAGGTLRPYHVGDSAILVAGQRGKLKLQTVSHSPVGYAVESGLLGEREAMHHDDRHLISNTVGVPDMRIEIGSPLRLAPRDTLLLATDGLLDNLGVGEIVDRIRRRPLDVVTRALAECADERMRTPRTGQPSKPDDITFVVFRLTPPARSAGVDRKAP